MPKQNPLLNIVKKQKEGKAVAIYSCCSSNAFVIEAAMETAKKQDSCVLIESTANQVDQNGGYSGMTPKISSTSVMKKQKKLDYQVIVFS